jgi:hypothetical protein
MFVINLVTLTKLNDGLIPKLKGEQKSRRRICGFGKDANAKRRQAN